MSLANHLSPLEDTCGRFLNGPAVDRRLHCSVRVAAAAAAVAAVLAPAVAVAVALLGKCNTMCRVFSLHCLVVIFSLWSMREEDPAVHDLVGDRRFPFDSWLPVVER